MSPLKSGTTSKEDLESSQSAGHQQWNEKASSVPDIKASDELGLDQEGVHANAKITGESLVLGRHCFIGHVDLIRT